MRKSTWWMPMVVLAVTACGPRVGTVDRSTVGTAVVSTATSSPQPVAEPDTTSPPSVTPTTEPFVDDLDISIAEIDAALADLEKTLNEVDLSETEGDLP